jgi:hypothetical protein
VEQAGGLGSCIPAKSDNWDCDGEECWCVGTEGCAVLAASTCENGSCGDCDVGDCCCDFPSE